MMNVTELTGLWTRSLMAWPDGRRDTTTNVAWMQGISAYADLRQPPELAGRFRHATCLRDLTLADCLLLATQQAFAGTFVPVGEHFEWQRHIDFQPPRETRDIGQLYWQGDILIEAGLQGEYIEHWHRDPALPATPCAALILQGERDGRWGQLLRVGNLFMFARDRQQPALGKTMAACVTAAPSLLAAQDAIDFEISFGQISPEGWRITRSTLPFRQDSWLRHKMTGPNVLIDDVAPDGGAFVRSWKITVTEGDTSVFIDANREIL